MPRPLPRVLRGSSDTAATTASRPSPRPRPRPRATPDGADGVAGTTPVLSASGEFTADPVSRVPFAGASRRLVVTLVAVVAVLVLAAGALGFLRWQAARSEQAATDALGSARSGAETLFSYDYRTIDNDIAAAKKVVTGKLATDYAATSATIKPLAAKNLAIVKAAISEAGVVSASPDRVVVFLYLNQTTQSKNVAATKVDMSRVRVTMVRVGDDWRIARAEPL